MLKSEILEKLEAQKRFFAEGRTLPVSARLDALGEKMLNDKFDQIKTSDNTWGLVDTDAGTKGYSGTADKTEIRMVG